MESNVRRRRIRGRRRSEVQIDEIGELGNDPQLTEAGYRPSLIFGFGTTETNDTDSEVRIRDYIADLIHGEEMQEVKARKIKNPETKGLYAGLLGMTRANRNGFYVDKKGELPEGWQESDGTSRIIGLLLLVIRWYMENYPDTVLFFRIDSHNSYRSRRLVDANIGALSTDIGKPIFYEIVDSKKDRPMQANDMVPNSLYEEHERNNGYYAERLHVNEHRLDSSDSIRLLITAADLEQGYMDGSDKCKVANKNRRAQWNSAPYRRDQGIIADLLINDIGVFDAFGNPVSFLDPAIGTRIPGSVEMWGA